MPWWIIASLGANVSIAGVEYFNRVSTAPTFLHQLMLTAPLIFAAQYGLYHCWRGAPSMFMAWAVFTVGNAVIRVLSVRYVLGEPVDWMPTLAGIAVMMGGAYLVKVGS